MNIKFFGFVGMIIALCLIGTVRSHADASQTSALVADFSATIVNGKVTAHLSTTVPDLNSLGWHAEVMQLSPIGKPDPTLVVPKESIAALGQMAMEKITAIAPTGPHDGNTKLGKFPPSFYTSSEVAQAIKEAFERGDIYIQFRYVTPPAEKKSAK